MNKNFISIIALIFVMGAAGLAAQDTSGAFSDDALFGAPPAAADEAQSEEGSEADLFGGTLVEDIPEDAVSTAVSDLLESDGVIIGGKFSLSTDVDFIDDPGNVTAELSSRLFLDARPSSDFGVYIKGDLEYDPEDGVDAELREMFADTNIADTVFFRAGKQAVNWGVGYFYSPANVVNLETIDPENPDEELLGPMAVKAHLPAGTTNLYGWVILEDFDGTAEPRFAAMGQFLLGNVEVSLGGIYQWDAPWAGVLTATTAIGDVSVFGEAVVEGNVDKTFVVADETSMSVLAAEAASGLYFSATAGFNYLWTSEDENWTVMLLGQYYYNGLGYADQTVISNNMTALGALVGAGELAAADLMNRGQHYGAASLSFSDLYGTGLTPSVFWMGNPADGSGRVTTGLTYGGLDHLSFNASWSRAYGDAGMEFSPEGLSDAVSLSISFTDSKF